MAKDKELATLDIDDLVIDDDLQIRVNGLDEEHIKDLMEELGKKAGSLPRIKVMKVANFGNVVYDGHHTIEAHRRLKRKKIQATVVVGTNTDLYVAAANANREHDTNGLKRSRADKINSIVFLCRRLEAEDQNWVDKRIADALGISDKTVKAHRPPRNSEVENSEEIPLDDPPRESADGRKFSTPRPKPEATPAPKPEAKPKKAQVGTWEEVPINEFLDVDGFVRDALDRSRINKAGDLYKRILAGELFGLPKGEVLDMRKACESMRDTFEALPSEKPVEKKQGAEAGFNLREFDVHYGHVARSLDAIPALHPGEHNAMERRACEAALKEFREMFDRWAKRLMLGAK